LHRDNITVHESGPHCIPQGKHARSSSG
jgi:hypothetical protein